MKNDIDKITSKLAKLIRLSEDNNASDGEIENALNMAQQIMAKHNLTRDDIDTENDDFSKIRMNRAFVTCLNNNASTWESLLARFCSDFVKNCGYYKNSGFYGINKTSKRTVFFFYGSENEVEVAIDLFNELQQAISTMAVTRYNTFYRGDGGAYAEGFVNGLREANERARIELEEDEQTSALILMSDKTSLAIVNEAKNWLSKEHNVRLYRGPGTRGASGSGNARSLGRKDGKNYNIGNRKATKKISV